MKVILVALVVVLLSGVLGASLGLAPIQAMSLAVIAGIAALVVGRRSRLTAR